MSVTYTAFSLSTLVIAISHLIATQDSLYRIIYPLFNKSGYMLIFVNGIACLTLLARSAIIKLVFGEIRILESEVRETIFTE